MSIKEQINSSFPSMISASNAESSAMEMLNSWKALSNNNDWNNEACIAAGQAAINYSAQWKNAVIPAIEEEIEKYKAEYEEKKLQHDSAKQMYIDAGRAIDAAKKDMDACMDYKRDGGPWQDTHMKGDTKIVVDPIGYAAAQSRKAKAISDRNRYQTEMLNWKKQMDAVNNKMKSAEHKKKELEEKIEKFILDVYSIKLMDECADFLKAIKTSSLTLSQKAQKTLFGRLFLLEHTYRKSFEKFQQIISESKDKYQHTKFDVSPDSLTYSAERSITEGKFTAAFSVICHSKDTNSAELKYYGKKDFHIPKAKAETAQKDISSKCNAFTLSAERSSFAIVLDKKFENDEIDSELKNINVNSDSYSEECKTLLETFKANGASASKFRIKMDKLSNWHLNHWVKLWYKIVFILAVIIVLAGIGVGGYFGISAAIDKHIYNKSFTSWIITDKKAGNGYHRYNFDDGTIRKFNVSVVADDKLDSALKTFIEDKTAANFIPMTEEEIEWYKTLISECGFVKASSSSTIKLSGNFRNKVATGQGYFKVTTDAEGKVTEIISVSGLGDFYYRDYVIEKYFSENK